MPNYKDIANFQEFSAGDGVNPYAADHPVAPRYKRDHARNTASGEVWVAVATEATTASWVELAQDAVLVEESARAKAAEADGAAARRTLSARQYSGGYSTLAASTMKRGRLHTNGVAWTARLLASGTGTLFDAGSMQIALTDESGGFARVQVSIILATGTLVVRTAARVFPLGKWTPLCVSVDTPSNGTLSAASVHVFIGTAAATLTTTADYSGTAADNTNPWYFNADGNGENAVACIVAVEAVLNYPLTLAEWQDFVLSGLLPEGGTGISSYGVTGKVTTPHLLPFPALIGDDVADVACGTGHIMILTASGKLYGVGQNNYGQLGVGDYSNRYVPTLVASGVASVACGEYHTLYVTTDGGLFGMGLNTSGQLGTGDQTNKTAPTQVATGVASCACGLHHSLYITTSGVLYGIGSNAEGQLGQGSMTYTTTPIQIATDVSSGDCGQSFSLYVTTGGILYGMGQNSSGQLGLGDTNNRTTPTQVTTGVAAVACGSYHSAHITTGQVMYVAGANASGQLGVGDTATRLSPVQAASGVNSVACGRFHTMYITTGGILYVTGANNYGQIGQGTLAYTASPLQQMDGVAAVACGLYLSACLTSDGVLYGFGTNDQGQLSGHMLLGNLLAGLDLSAQPVCARLADGSVLVDSESGVDLWPAKLQDRVILATPAAMTADGYLIGDRTVHPAGYHIGSVRVTNSGSAAATVTVRAGSSSGTTIATGSVAADGLSHALTLSADNALEASGGKIHISGGSSTAPLTITITLGRS